MDLSLDDIIQKRKIKFPSRGRGGTNPQRQQGRRNIPVNKNNANQNKNFQRNRNPGVKPNVGRIVKSTPPRPIDARLKIIQKNRQKLTDAREKLGEIAQQTDARLKLDKLRQGRQGGHLQTHGGNQRILNRRARELQPSYKPNVNIPLQRMQPRRGIQDNLHRTIHQNIKTYTIPNDWYGADLDDMDVDMECETPLTGVSQVLRRTVPNEHASSRQLGRQSSMPGPSSWQSSQYRIPKEPEPRAYVDLDYPSEERSRPKPQSNQGLADRWSRSSTTAQSSAVKGRSAGYRIIISNLHPSVIHEDIQELFEDVGPLLESRLVRPGTAEVVFKQLKDAESAVEAYHNRQLDGQPMKCMLVNVRTSTSTPPPSHSALRTMSASISRTGLKVPSSTKSSVVVPDISTIHKALFNKV